MNRLDRNLSENIRIMALVVSEICQRSILQMASDSNLTSNQFTILRALSSDRDFQITDLARLLGISTAAVSKNIDRLGQLDLVARRINPEDRRSLELVLLKGGWDVLGRFDEILTEKQKHLMEQFSTPEKEVLVGLLRRVINFTVSEEQNTELICLQCGGNCGDNCVIETTAGTCSLKGKGPETQS
jgi:DNA-binding MarR family transcriptional regulator